MLKFTKKILTNETLLWMRSSHRHLSSAVGAGTVHHHPRHLEVEYDGEPLKLSYLWLRDHCRCEACYNHKTFQRKIMYYDIDPSVKPTVADINNEKLTLKWPDSHETNYSLSWLRDNCGVNLGQASEGRVEKYLWNTARINEQPAERVKLSDFLNDDESLKLFLTNLLKYGHAFIDEVKPDIESTQIASERICSVMETTFGKMWSFTADGKRADTAYTNHAIGAHTDSTYYQHTTGIQVFHCLYHDGDGGESLLVDGHYCAEELRKTNPDAFNLLANTPVHHEYIDEGSRDHIFSLAPILDLHPFTKQLIQIRYNNYDRSALKTIPQDVIDEYYEALKSLTSIIHNKQNEYWLKLKPGTVMFVDNFRNLHGRSSFNGKRVVCGNYLARDDWLSRARYLGLTV
ncbi:trimethyllysine dioxygenase, mitochondrial-like isoform X2 [Tubulanus polymorphus]|uniref:trimethyllysine dioxygenase, mitochondrial-like isoform X2 n=1 Tax=Tubulanus polymorphus TaxID=672921 RepID=UPI003DA28F6C